jgi:hypothetical protein
MSNKGMSGSARNRRNGSWNALAAPEEGPVGAEVGRALSHVLTTTFMVACLRATGRL